LSAVLAGFRAITCSGDSAAFDSESATVLDLASATTAMRTGERQTENNHRPGVMVWRGFPLAVCWR